MGFNVTFSERHTDTDRHAEGVHREDERDLRG